MYFATAEAAEAAVRADGMDLQGRQIGIREVKRKKRLKKSMVEEIIYPILLIVYGIIVKAKNEEEKKTLEKMA